MKKFIQQNILKVMLIVVSICFALPSFFYVLNMKTVLGINGNVEYCFLLTNQIDRLYQAAIFALLLLLFLVYYVFIIKKREKLFQNKKQVYCFILVISIIFMTILPFMSSDIFYYIGIGRLNSTYRQNPYYTDIKSYVDINAINLENDTAMLKGYQNYWSNTTVVYGAFWTFLCSVFSFFSFGNLEVALLIFKLANLAVHMGNCILLYRISNKKIFPLLYGLNPFILIEGIANVHNDLFVIFFILLAIFMLLKKKKFVLSLFFLALATAIKYVPILLLPFLLLYQFKDKEIKERIQKCILYGLLFFVFLAIPYLLYIHDMNVFAGIFVQRERIAKGLYLFISQYFTNPPKLVDKLKNVALFVFALLYILKCISLLFTKKIKFSKEMQDVTWFFIAFLFFLITNFQPWYFIWLAPLIIWQKADNIKLIIQMQMMTLIADIVFFIYSEGYKNGVPFFTIFVVGTLVCVIINQKKRINRKGATK